MCKDHRCICRVSLRQHIFSRGYVHLPGVLCHIEGYFPGDMYTYQGFNAVLRDIFQGICTLTRGLMPY